MLSQRYRVAYEETCATMPTDFRLCTSGEFVGSDSVASLFRPAGFSSDLQDRPFVVVVSNHDLTCDIDDVW